MGSEGELDGVMDALGNEYRRRLLLALREHNPQAAADLQGAEDALSPDTELSVDAMAPQARMYHAHLPKLESRGFIRWNRQDGTIEKGPKWDEIEPFLESLSENEYGR